MGSNPFAPMSTKAKPVQDLDALAQCTRCKQVSSYDRVDALLGRTLACPCGGELRLFAFGQQGRAA